MLNEQYIDTHKNIRIQASSALSDPN